MTTIESLLKNRMLCTKCGAAYSGAAFCGFDGSSLIPTGETPPKYCQLCKRFFPDEVVFCPDSGHRLTDCGATKVCGSGQQSDSSASTTATLVSTEATVPSERRPELTASDGRTQQISRSETAPAIGSLVGNKYIVESELGSGGMATVYLATHVEIGKHVVVKLMHHRQCAENATKRFEQEIAISAKFDHPNLISVFDGGMIDGSPFLVMEYIDGESLRAYMRNKNGLPLVQAVEIVSQMCAGLSEAHEMGIVHRDLKPENVMLRKQSDRPDWVKVVDFGIAHLKNGAEKLTETGMAVGTAAYMSPEYLSDKPIDGRADIYALGVILYELLTGRQPFEGEHVQAVLAKTLFEDAEPPSIHRPDVPRLLDEITLRALAKDPSDRFRTTIEMRQVLTSARSVIASAI